LLLLCEPPEPFEPEFEEPEFEHCPCEANAGDTATADVRAVRKMAVKREALVIELNLRRRIRAAGPGALSLVSRSERRRHHPEGGVCKDP
jgi:hypothetical protein